MKRQSGLGDRLGRTVFSISWDKQIRPYALIAAELQS